jgi:Xaa-Pro aminopeptidase
MCDSPIGHVSSGLENQDWTAGVDLPRMRQQRKERARALMLKHGFDALLLYDAANIRYVSSTVAGISAQGSRFCLLPGDNDPIVWEIGCDAGRELQSAPWLHGRVRQAIPLRFAPEEVALEWAADIKRTLKEEGLSDPLVGVDTYTPKMMNALDAVGIKYADASKVLFEARMIKNADEIECCRQSIALAEGCFDIAQTMMRPGVRERDLQAEMAHYLYRFGAEGMAVIASGDHTNPYWRRTLNDRMFRPGDLVIIDRIHALNGYPCDYVRTFVVGDKATPKQGDLHKECYDYMYSAIDIIKPGVTTVEVAEKLHEAEDYSEFTLQFGHGIGLSIHEPPYITLMSKYDPVVLEPNMTLAVETFVGEGKQGVRLEENLVVTETGFEIMSRYPFDSRLSGH